MRLVSFVLAMLLMAACAGAAQAGPRFSGRLVKLDSAKRVVVFTRSDGKTCRALVRKDAIVKRLGVDAPMNTFRPGDYIVVEIVGPLNDVPLDASALYDVHTAGRAPSAIGSAPHTEQGGFVTGGGPAAPSIVGHQPEAAVIGIGGTQGNVPLVGHYEVHSKPAEHAGHHDGPGVGPYGPNTNAHGTQTIQIKPVTEPTHSGPFVAAPAPAGSPYTAQVIAQGGVSQPQSNVTTPPPAPQPIPPPVQQYPTAQTYPQQQAPANPNVLISGEDTPVSSNPSMPEIVSMQGNVSQVVPARRMFYVQALVNGKPAQVAVIVPQQVMVISTKSQQMVGVETLRVGDFVMLQGMQGMGGVVEARKVFLNN
ncbi:MAG: hypothetical protein FJX76_17490 [Armatimonadetes bacterium]|nr:hypothetical protein [Armatimonadota bacterium]